MWTDQPVGTPQTWIDATCTCGCQGIHTTACDDWKNRQLQLRLCKKKQTPTLSGLSREVVAACKQEREHYTSLLSNFAVFSLTVGHRGESHLEEGL